MERIRYQKYVPRPEGGSKVVTSEPDPYYVWLSDRLSVRGSSKWGGPDDPMARAIVRHRDHLSVQHIVGPPPPLLVVYKEVLSGFPLSAAEKEEAYRNTANLLVEGFKVEGATTFRSQSAVPNMKVMPSTSAAPKKVGIIAIIIGVLKAASATKPVTKDQILEVLVKTFPDRSKDAMRSTVSSQVPSGLKTEKKLVAQTDGKGGWWLS